MTTNAERSVRGDRDRRNAKIRAFVDKEFKNSSQHDKTVASTAIFMWDCSMSSHLSRPTPTKTKENDRESG